MSVIFPNDKSWLANSWISRGFFEDALRFAPLTSQLKADLQFCNDADVDTLDMRAADSISLRNFCDVVERVIAYNDDHHGNNFADREAFPMYHDKLHELKTIVDDVLKDL